MIDADLVVSLGSDDPTMVHTDLAQEYLQLSAELSYGPSTIRRLCLNALETSWLDDDKRGLRRELVGEVDALEALLDQAEPGRPAHDRDVAR
jgi:adenosine deaminase